MDTREWITKLSDSERIVDLTIPGTHDSMTAGTPVPFTETQSWSVAQQLQRGIRFFDIRIDRAGIEYAYVLKHGIVPLGEYYTGFVKDVLLFLQSHPNEFLIVSLKNENNQTFTNADYEALSRFLPTYKCDKDLKDVTVKDVRGKVVVLNRMGVDGGYKWDNQSIQDSFELDVIYKEIVIIPYMRETTQRVYYPKPTLSNPFNFEHVEVMITPEIKERTQRAPVGMDFGKKTKQIEEHLKNAISNKKKTNFNINFCSAVNGEGKTFPLIGSGVSLNANIQNEFLLDFFTKKTQKKIGALIFLDYPNQELVNQIIGNNF
ncbi:MAG: hypothetical protein IT236_18005 [Bacteroidia bacterium]|nr:hypothetical protein [Bacteroidia bacterium]